MCEQTEINYLDGEVVWVKLGSCWWPGEVVALEKLPPDVLPSFRKPPIACVKFFQEDAYEYVKNINNIYKYNCSRKNEFISKGLYMFRTKHGHMEKFPEDIIRAETAIGGDLDILSREEFQEAKKESYAGLFGDPRKQSSAKKGKNALGRLQAESTNITPRRLMKEKTDYKVHILVQGPKTTPAPDTTVSALTPPLTVAEDAPQEQNGPSHEEKKQNIEDNAESQETPNASVPVPATPLRSLSPCSTPSSSGTYACHACPFTTARLNVLILHNKTHSVSFIPYTPSPVRKKLTTLKSLPKSIQKSTSSISKTPKSRKPKAEKKLKKIQLKKRPSEEKSPSVDAKKPKTDEEIKSSLLADWDDDAESDTGDEASAQIAAPSPEVPAGAACPVDPTSCDPPAAQSALLTSPDKKLTSPSAEKPESSSDSKYEFCEDEDWPEEADFGRKIPRVKNPIRTEDPKTVGLDEDDVAREVAELLNKTAVPELPSVPEPLKIEENFPELSIVKSPDKNQDKIPEKPVDKGVTEHLPNKAIFKTKTFFRSRHSRSQDAIGKYVAEQLNAVERMDISECEINGSEAVSSPEARESPPIEPVKVARLAPKIQLKKMKAEAAQLREKEKMEQASEVLSSCQVSGLTTHEATNIPLSYPEPVMELPVSKGICKKNTSEVTSSQFVQDVLYPTQEIKPMNSEVHTSFNTEIVEEPVTELENISLLDRYEEEIVQTSEYNKEIQRSEEPSEFVDESSKYVEETSSYEQYIQPSQFQGDSAKNNDSMNYKEDVVLSPKFVENTYDKDKSDTKETTSNENEVISDVVREESFNLEEVHTNNTNQEQLQNQELELDVNQVPTASLAEPKLIENDKDALIDKCANEVQDQKGHYLNESTASAVDALLSVSRETDRVPRVVSNDLPEDLFEDDHKDVDNMEANDINNDFDEKMTTSSNFFVGNGVVEHMETEEVQIDNEIQMENNLVETSAPEIMHNEETVDTPYDNSKPIVLEGDAVVKEFHNVTSEENKVDHEENNFVQVENEIVLEDSEVFQEENVVAQEENVIVQEDNVMVQEDNVIVQEDHLTVQDDNVIVQEDHPTVQDDNVIVQEDHPTVQDDNEMIQDSISEVIQEDNEVVVEDSEVVLENVPSESDLQVAEALINLPATAIQNKISTEHKESLLLPLSFDNENSQEEIPVSGNMLLNQSEIGFVEKDVALNSVEKLVELNPASDSDLNSRFETEQEKCENLNAAKSLVQMSESIEHTMNIVEQMDTSEITDLNLNKAKHDNGIETNVNSVEHSLSLLSNDNKIETATSMIRKSPFDQSSSKLLKILEEPCKPRIVSKPAPKQLLMQGKEKILNFDVAKTPLKGKTSKQKIIIRRTPVPNKSVLNNTNELVGSDNIVLSRSGSAPQDGSALQTFTIHTSPDVPSDANTIIIQQKIRKINKPTIIQPKLQKIKPQTSLVTPMNELKTTTKPQTTDDAMFDINSMPIVLSEDLLTAESIEKMPVVMSDANIIGQSQSTTKIVKQKQKVIEHEKVSISSGPNKPEVKTLLLNPSDGTKSVTPNILSKSSKLRTKPMLVIDKTTGKQKIIMTKAEPAVKELKQAQTIIQPVAQATQASKTEKFIILPTQTSAPRPARTQKIVIDPQTGKAHVFVAKGSEAPLSATENKPVSAKLMPSNSDASAPGNTVMIITNAQGAQSRIVLTPEHEKILFPNKQQPNVSQLKTIAHRITTTTPAQKTVMTAMTSAKTPTITPVKTPTITPVKTSRIYPKQKNAIITSKGQLIVGGRVATTAQNIAPMPELRPVSRRVLSSEPKKQLAQKTNSEPIIFLQQKSGAVMQLTAAQFEHLQRTGQIVQKAPAPAQEKIVIQKVKPAGEPGPSIKRARRPLAAAPPPAKKLKHEVAIAPAPPAHPPPPPAPVPGLGDFDNFEEMLPSTAIARAVAPPPAPPPAPAPPPPAPAPGEAALADGQLLAVPGEHFGGLVGTFYLCVEENGTFTPIDNRPLVLENNQLVPMEPAPPPPPAPAPPGERRDILEAALANSDVFRADAAPADAPDFRDLNANVSVHCRVSETSSTLHQPIMTAAEVPSLAGGEREPPAARSLEAGLAVIGVAPGAVPTSLDLPITVTDPRIAPKTADPLAGTRYAPAGPIHMPLLTDELGPAGKSMPILEEGAASPSGSGSDADADAAWPRRLLTPAAGSDESEASVEIPLQPAIQLSSSDLHAHS